MSLAAVFLIIATFLFTFINIGVKLLPNLPPSEIVLFRALATGLLSLLLLKKNGISVKGNNLKVLLWRGLWGTISLFCFFWCLHIMPLAVAATFIGLSPIYGVLLGHIFMGEKANKYQWLCLMLAFVGVYFIKAGIGGVELSWFQLGLGLVTPLFAAGAYTCIRMLKDTDHPFVIILFFSLVTVPLIGPVALYQWQPLTLKDWAILGGIGVLTQTAQYFMTVAYQKEPAAKVMIYNYSGLLWSALFGWFVFSEALSSSQFLGISLVLLSLVGNHFAKSYKHYPLFARS